MEKPLNFLYCFAAKDGSKVVGDPDFFGKVINADGSPGRVAVVGKTKPPWANHINVNNHVVDLLSRDCPERADMAYTASQVLM